MLIIDYCLLIVIFYFSVNVCAHDDIVYPCKTPNAETGVCVSLFSCPILMRSLGTLQHTAIQFVKKSVCSNYTPGDLKVCCGTRGNYLGLNDVSETSSYSPPSSTNPFTLPLSLSTPFTTEAPTSSTGILYTSVWNNSTQVTTTTVSTTASTTATATFTVGRIEDSQKQQQYREYVKKRLLPSLKYCGLQHTDDRFYTENITALDEFPWLVHVIFLDDADEDPLQYLDRCNGVLLNNLYVLTIGTCANQAPAVRLGQHNVNKTISCIANPDFPECTEPKYDVAVVEEIHRAGDVVKHDFALLRLVEKVQYSDFVRPICLPFPEYKRPEKVNSLVFSGWGALSQEIAAIKKRLSYNLTDGIDECLKLDDTDLKNFTSNNSVMCLLPDEQNAELACTGDEGGPLMFRYRNQWFAEGLLSSVYDWFQEGKVSGVFKNTTIDSCSNTLPISGIRITNEILNWIMDNIRP